MTRYTDRIPVAPEYTQALGEVYYNFAVATWAMVYLISLKSDGYVNLAANVASATLSRDFTVVATATKDIQFIDLSKQYQSAVDTRNELLTSVGITGVAGEQMLSANAKPWPIERLNDFAKQLESLDIAAVGLYYELKPNA